MKKYWIYIIVGVVISAGAFYFFRRRRRKRKNFLATDKPVSAGKRFVQKALTNPESAESELLEIYERAKNLSEDFQTVKEKEAWRTWLEEEKNNALKYGNMLDNLGYWIHGIVKSPEASLFRTYLIDENGFLLKESAERVAQRIDKSFLDTEKYAKLPSVNVTSKLSQGGTIPKNLNPILV